MASPPVSVAAVPSSADVPQLKRTPTIPDDDWEFVDSIIPIVPPRPEFIPGRWRTVRIFISSTFIDMHGERDCLIHEVFPEINNRVKDLYVRVIPVDLRWGVSKEETDTIQTTCLDEIDRCRSHDLDLPWFIGLRGERYGWVQEKYNSPRQFACPLNTQWLKEVDKNGVDLSITSMEVYHAFTGAAAIKRGVASTEHTISHSFFCKRKTEFCNQVAPEHKWIFEFEFKRPDEQIMEANRLQYTVTDRAKRFWLDKQELDQAIVASTLPKVIFEYDCKLDKTEITGQLPNGKRFGCGWVGGLKGFRETLITEITKSIEREYEPPGDLDDDQKESAFHASLIADRAEGFLGRQDLIEQALNYCLQDTKAEVAPMVLVGAPGAGKSAVMARVCQLIQEKKNEDYIYIPHLIGASTDSIYVRKLLMRLCKQLKRQAQVVIAEDVSDDYVILCAQFISILTKTALNKKVVLVIDAINQLAPDHKAHRMKWLPAVLPPNVRILLSTLEFENNTFQNTLEQFPAAKVVNCGALSQTEQTQLVSQYLARYHKKLTQNDSDKFLGNQMALLLAKEQAISPLYLVLACDALRRFGVYEQLTGYIKQLPTTLPKLFVHVLEGVEGVHGKELTVAAFALVAVSRGGLMETEVNAALERMDLGSRVSNFARIYGQTYNFFAAGGSGYLKFFHDQLLYVTRERYSFGGPEPKDLDLTAHSALGGYFLEVVERHMAGAEQYNIEHACAEVVFHLVHAERWANVLDLLSRMDFIVLSLRLRTLADLVADFTIFQNYVEKHARAGSAVDKTTVRQVELIKDALKMSADKVRADVGMAPYQLWCRLNGERALPLVGDLLDFAKWTRGLADQRWGLEGEGAVVVRSDGESKDGEDAPKKKRPAAGQDALHHAAPPPIPAFTTGFNRPGGALQYELYCEGSGCGTLELYDDKVNDCLSALAYTERGEQCFLNTSVLNLDAGVVLASLAPPLYTQTLQNTKGHLWLDAGKRVLTYGHNGTMNLWDLTNTAKTPVLFRGHANCTVWMHWICESVLGVSALTDDPNETRLLSYGNNGKVLLWDRSTAQPHFLYGHSGDNGGGRNGVHGTHVFASGTRAISWGTNQLILWDLMQKCLLSQRQGMREWANNGPWHVIPTKDWKQNGAAALVTSDKFEVLDFNADKIDVQSWEQQIGTMVASEARGSTFFVAAEKSIFTYDLNEKQFQHMPELSRGETGDDSVVPGVSKPKKQAAELVAPTRPPHRYWRIAAFEGGKNWNIRQIQFFSDVPRLFAGTESKEQAVDGKVGETTTGGQPFSTSNYPGHPPPSAFDGNLNGCFAFDQDERPMAIGWDFGQGNEKDIRRVRFLNGRDFDGVPEFTVQWSDDGKSWNDDWKMKISNYTEQRGKIWDESVVPGVRDRDSEGGDSDSDDEEDDFGFQFDAGFRFWRLSITSSHNNELGLFRFGLLSVEGQDITVSKKAFSSVPTQPSFSPTMALSANPAFYWTNQDAVKNFPVFFTVDVGMPRPACQLVLKPIKGSLKEFSLFASNDPEFSEKRTVQLLKSDHDETDEEVTYNIANPATGVCPRPLTCTASTRVLTSRVIAIGDSDGGVSLLQFPSMAVLSKVSPSPHRSAVLKFFVRADHQVIASSDQSGKLVIWKLDVDKQQLVPTAVLAGGHISACQGALLFANGSFASWSPDAFNYWVVKGDSVSCHPLQGHTNSVTGAFLIPNSGEKQIVSHSDKDIAVIKWDLEKPLQSLLAHAGEIVATLLLTRSLRAVTVSRELFLWDLAEEKDAKQSRGHLLERVDFIGKAVGMELVPLGPAEPETVVVWTEEPVIRLISFPTDPTLPQVQVQALQSHQAGVRGVVQRPLPELPGRVDLLTWATDRTIIYFVHEGPGQYRPVVVEPEPGLRAMSQLQLFDLHGVYDRHKIGILGLTDGTIWTWELDLKTGKYVVHKVAAVHQNMRVLPSQTEAFMSGSSITTYQLPSLQALATQNHGNCFVYDFCGGRRMVTGCTSAMVKLWEVGQPTINQLWGGSHDGGLIQGAIHGLKYVAEDIFISWAHDHKIKVWDIKNRTIATLSAHKNDPSGVVFATVGATSFLASWSRAEDRVLLWKLFEEPADGSAVVPIWFASFDTSPAQVVMKTDNDALRIFVSLMDGSVTYFSIPVPLADGTKAKELSPESRPRPQLASGSASATSASTATSLSNTSASATSSSTAAGGGGACEVFSPSGSAASVVWAGTKCKSCGQPKRAHS